ncbi:hypothetical protein [Bradyrhizobium neotropicale]|uniref:hypothetical protein n=1 Tax=Bradyrhizobium neotropicale TaxID=1497615 RepID=UPI001AD7D09C|nr:hypothetical protein [Bradyrhizobium neotropicale]MBO4221950.1 hypothetical protein [Bradyrhizobium neotropicale]
MAGFYREVHPELIARRTRNSLWGRSWSPKSPTRALQARLTRFDEGSIHLDLDYEGWPIPDVPA